MRLTIKSKAERKHDLHITVNGVTKPLNEAEECACFDVKQAGLYTVYIEEEKTESNIKSWNIILFICTFLLQGLFNALLMDAGADWYKRITPNCVKAEINIYVDQDMELLIRYKNSEYYKDEKRWSEPVFVVEPLAAVEIKRLNFTINLSDFNNQYFNYVKRSLSVLSILWLILGLVLYQALKSPNNLVGSIFTAAILISSALLMIAVCIRERKRLKQIIDIFIEKNSLK